MKRNFGCIFVAFAVFFFAACLANAAPVGKITRLEGKVDVLKAGQGNVASVSLGDVVDVGNIYRAKTNSRAEITFFNNNILRIAPATRVQISQYSDDGTRSNQVMKLDRGKVEAVSGKEFIKKVSSFAEGNKFEVHTPNAVAGIRGSGMTVGFAQMVTGLFFSTGRGYFYNPSAPGRIV
ncbi:MAG: FecR domain-containing protein, partial [Syntrophorhabdaceae bacterium]